MSMASSLKLSMFPSYGKKGLRTWDLGKGPSQREADAGFCRWVPCAHKARIKGALEKSGRGGEIGQ